VSHADDVQRQPHVDALLLAGSEAVRAAVGKSHVLRSIAKRPTIDVNALTADRPQLALPEPMPEQVVALVRDTGVEACLNESPPKSPTQALGQCIHVVVGMAIAKGDARGVKQILAVDKDDCALGLGFDGVQRKAG
jgi:hypothetical protein